MVVSTCSLAFIKLVRLSAKFDDWKYYFIYCICNNIKLSWSFPLSFWREPLAFIQLVRLSAKFDDWKFILFIDFVTVSSDGRFHLHFKVNH